MKKYITALSLLVVSVSAFGFNPEIAELSLNGNRNSNSRASFHFIEPMTVPFNLFTEKQLQQIEAQNSEAKFGFLVTFINGLATRVTNPIESLLQGIDYQAALRVALPDGVWRSSEPTPEVSYCRMHLYLNGKKNADGYTVQPERDQIPYDETQVAKDTLSVNWGPLVTERFGVFYELRPEERPNPMTGGAKSKEIYSLGCIRHAKDGNGASVGDFLKAIGSDKVEVKIINN